MSDFLKPIKDAVKQTPLWLALRPRRIHVYGVGAPRTGTLSLTRLFGEYRSAHEPHLDRTVELIKAQPPTTELQGALRKRDRRWRLECEVGFPLVYFSEVLAREFPESKFICTVRPPARGCAPSSTDVSIVLVQTRLQGIGSSVTFVLGRFRSTTTLRSGCLQRSDSTVLMDIYRTGRTTTRLY